MRPTEVLMMQADLRDRLSDPEGMFSNIVTETVAGMWDTTKDRARIAALSASAAAANGETFLVEPSMSVVIEAAAASLDDSDRVDMNMFPSRAGVIRFVHPIEFTDIRGSQCKVHWVTWTGTTYPHTNAFGTPTMVRSQVLTMWNDVADPDEVTTSVLDATRQSNPRALPEILRTIGRWQCVGSIIVRDGQKVGASSRSVRSEEVAEAEKLDDAYGGAYTGPAVQSDAEVFNLSRIIWATILLMGQEIVSTSRSTHSKAESKVLRRRRANDVLTVITLRRKRVVGEDGQGAGHEYDHRWLTRGHFAWRHCGESHPMAQPYEKGYRARVWINPYLKGPEDAPVRVTKKVNRLAR